jgi:hypothetical protein
MLVASSVCPQPPLLVSGMGGTASSRGPDEIGHLRASCLESVRRLTRLDVPHLVVVGAATTAGDWDGRAGGDLRDFGLGSAFGGNASVLPLSLTVGAYLLDTVGWPTDPRRYVAVAGITASADCAAVGQDLASTPEPLALLVMADGSAKRATTSPGYLDADAVGYDESVVRALVAADVDALLACEPEFAARLWVAGRPALQVLAGAARTAYADGATITTRLRYDAAPYGVGYAVVDWDLTYPSGE